MNSNIVAERIQCRHCPSAKPAAAVLLMYKLCCQTYFSPYSTWKPSNKTHFQNMKSATEITTCELWLSINFPFSSSWGFSFFPAEWFSLVWCFHIQNEVLRIEYSHVLYNLQSPLRQTSLDFMGWRWSPKRYIKQLAGLPWHVRIAKDTFRKFV